MPRVLIGLIILGIIILGVGLYFFGGEVVQDQQTSPTPTALGQNGTPPQALQADLASTTNRNVDGTVRIVETPDNNLLSTVVFDNEQAVTDPVQVALHRGTCDSIGDEVATISTVNRVYEEELLNMSMENIWTIDENRIMVVREIEEGGSVLACGNVNATSSLEALTLPTSPTPSPTLTPMLSPTPSPGHDPAETGGFLW